MDEIDLVQENMARESLIKPAKKKELKYKGTCYNCDESVSFPARFCDVDCREDYELREKLNAS